MSRPVMPSFLYRFSLTAFIPYGHCYPWKAELAELHILSDGLFALAYYSISAALFYFVRKRQDLPLSWIFLLFAAFIAACGTTHLLEIWALWYPPGWVFDGLEAVLALISFATAVLLVPLVSKALELPSSEQLQAANQALEQEIAERQQVEAALRESEEKYRLLFSNELDAVSLFDTETGEILDVNEAFETLYGYSRVEAMQLKVADVSAEPAQSQAAIRTANSTGKARIYLRWHRKKNGVIFPVELCVGRFTWNNRPVMCAVARDITERQQAEAVLRASEERFRLLLQDLHVGVLVQGADAEILLSNSKALQLLGLTEDQLLGKTSFDPSWNVIHEDGSPFPGNLHPVPQAITTGQPVRNVVMGVYHPQNKNRMWLLVSAEPQLDEEGNIRQVICTFSDISERKAAEEKLKKQHELLQTIMDHVPIMVDFIDSQGQVQWANRAWEKTLGWTAQELQEQNLLTKLYPDPLHCQRVLEFIQTATGKWQDFRTQTRNGTIINTTWANVRLSDGNTIGIGQDITERKLADEALKLADFSFERAAIAALWIGKNAQILRVNQGVCQMLGYSREELQSMHVYDIDPNFSSEIWSEHWKRLKHEKTLTLVSQHRAKDSSIIPIEVTINYLDFNGEEYNFAFVKDITERLETEAALRQQREREQLLVSVTEHIRQSLQLEEILDTAVAEVRQLLQSDRVVIYRFNPGVSGTIVAESVHSPDLSILHQQIYDPCFESGWQQPYQQGRISAIENVESSDVEPCYQQLLASLQVQANLVVPILHETTLWGLLVVHHCLAPHSWQTWEIDSLQQLAAQLAIAIQQSELYQQVQQFNARLEQQVEERTEQLKRSLDFEALLKRITDKVRDSLEEAQILQTAVQELALGLRAYSCDAGLYDLGQNTSTIHYETVRCEVPPAKGAIIALSNRPETYDPLLQGLTLQFSWMPEHPNPIRPVAKRLTTLACPIINDHSVIGDLWLYKAGEQCFEELEIRLVQQVANQCAIAVRQARLYQAAQLQVEELGRLNQLKDDFLSTVSHELRTPISNIKMATHMLEFILKPLGLLDPESGSASRYFEVLQHECQQEITLINDLLDLSRLSAKTEPLMLAEVELELWIPLLLDPFEAQARSQQQHLSVQIPTQLPTLMTDLGCLEQILAELLTNACKYTPSGETITISAIAEADGLEIRVSNSGTEIPTNELVHVFEKFYRVPNNDPWKHGGTGLGLALVQRRVELLQGSITVTSKQGLTTFTLLLIKCQAG
ncbi:PAS domain S-box protein [Leptolyngbya sp. FACHB-8]|uniref:sensor histidine kinase n=1 Tax=unclassified Leptolyngbya TaxID=2650499 RepID=UPI001684691D|nr:PAS domain S-box protein [Leptolyngbya sp. FACHB-8]MBD1911087.1 PAS domain S-box protein [Leptolyngbya sp. FACHB-8]